MLRQTRWLAAGLLAVAATLAAPSRSDAAFEVLIQEVDSSGNIVFGPGGIPASQIFTSNVSGYSTPSLTNINVSVVSNSGSGATPSLTVTVGAQSTASFDPTHSLRITATDLGFSTTAGTGTLTSSAGLSQGYAGGTTLQASGQAIVGPYLGAPLAFTGPPANVSYPGGPTTGTVLTQTGTATDTLPPGAPGARQAISPSTSLPDQYGIQMMVTIAASAPAGTAGITFGGTASTFATSSAPGPVPAPGGLLLAAAAIPALGLRRVLRKRAAA